MLGLSNNLYGFMVFRFEALFTGGGQILLTRREVLPVADYIFAVNRCDSVRQGRVFYIEFFR